MARKTPMTLEETKKWHAELARRPGIDEKVAEAKALYEKVKASGGLRRVAAPKRNRKTS